MHQPLRDTPTTGPCISFEGAFQRLASHMDIAWDVDGTLVGHPAASLLHRFIRATPHINHLIVTFRNERRHGTPWGPLGRYGDGPGPASFSRVVYLPDAMQKTRELAREGRGRSRWSALRRWLRAPDDPEFRAWKAVVCRQHGVTALVDDLTRVVASDCDRHGIELFHPSDFLPDTAPKRTGWRTLLRPGRDGTAGV